MSDHSAYGLVHRSSSLLVVPVSASKIENSSVTLSTLLLDFGVQVVSFQNDFRIVHLREGNAYDDYHSGCVV